MRRLPQFVISTLLVVAIVHSPLLAQGKPRARDLGLRFDGQPGPLNAITDIAGVEVGHTTLISDDREPVAGKTIVRTGVTAILPRGRRSAAPTFAGWFSLNGNGEMTGTAWVEESGLLTGPILLTNTCSVGVARDTAIAWQLSHGKHPTEYLPVVAECWDGRLNDIHGFHVKPAHVLAALDQARSGPLAEGNVGGGTGMVCFGFKGGIGTASRRLPEKAGGYGIGALVQANHGLRGQLRVMGIQVGAELGSTGADERETGSIIIVIATDAPLLPHQLKRVAKRASLGLARTGSSSGNGSGDIFIAFSTANAGAETGGPTTQVSILANELLDPLFTATVEATEEAIINALIAAETMTGIEGHTFHGIPHNRLKEVLQRHNQIKDDGQLTPVPGDIPASQKEAGQPRR